MVHSKPQIIFVEGYDGVIYFLINYSYVYLFTILVIGDFGEARLLKVTLVLI